MRPCKTSLSAYSLARVRFAKGLSSIYFHFCLLALFRRFIHSATDVAGTSPRVICAEAVQAILDVTQSYASLFTLRRTPCFVPYFVFAAGLTRIVLETDPSAMDSSPYTCSAPGQSPDTANTDTPSPYRRGTLDANSGSTPEAYMTGTDSAPTSASPGSSANTRSASPNISATHSTAATSVSAAPDDDRGMTQAVRQLQEMTVGHPGAAQARWVLRDLKPSRRTRAEGCSVVRIDRSYLSLSASASAAMLCRRPRRLRAGRHHGDV